VLVILPVKAMDEKKRRRGSEEDDDDEEDPLAVHDEQCFAGRVIEISDNHVRVHFDGLAKTDDVWVSIQNPKLFIDGGRWTEDTAAGIPALHYWQEMDSKRRCTTKSG
jgi:hypothetical protein